MKIAFLDRDGLLINEPQDDFQVDSLEKYEILPGVIDALKKLKSAGYELVMVTNQNGVGTDSFPENDFLLVQNKLIEDLKNEDIEFLEVFVCPHFSEDNCSCRKPKTGLVDEFLKNNPINFAESFMAGDSQTDLMFAENMGIKGYKGETNTDSLLKIVNQII